MQSDMQSAMGSLLYSHWLFGCLIKFHKLRLNKTFDKKLFFFFFLCCRYEGIILLL